MTVELKQINTFYGYIGLYTLEIEGEPIHYRVGTCWDETLGYSAFIPTQREDISILIEKLNEITLSFAKKKRIRSIKKKWKILKLTLKTIEYNSKTNLFYGIFSPKTTYDEICTTVKTETLNFHDEIDLERVN